MNERRATRDLDVPDIEAGWDLASERFIPEHRHAIVNGVAVAGELAFREHPSAGGVRLQQGARGLDVGNSLDQKITLSKRLIHGSLLFCGARAAPRCSAAQTNPASTEVFH